LTRKKPLKIAVLATVTDFGGAERVVLSLTEHIKNDEFDLVPIIFTVPSFTDNIFFKHLDRAGKKYYKVYVNNHKIKYLNPLANIFETYRLLKRNKFDLIHTHGYRADVLGIFLARLLGLPVISTCHGFISNDLHLTLYNRLDLFILRFARKIIAVSESIKSSLIKSGIKESSVTLIQNAVNGSYSVEAHTRNRKTKRKYCGMTEDDFVVGYVGRLSEEKGVGHLIEAIALLNKSGIPAKLLIIGEGPQRIELADRVKRANLEEKVFFTGFQDDVECWLSAMDVFTLPSLTEGTPVSLLEAMACGIPVVATAVGGVPQVIDSGKNGVLVSPGNPQDIKEAVQLLYKSEKLRNGLSGEAQKTINSQYNIEEWTRRIESEYLKLEK